MKYKMNPHTPRFGTFKLLGSAFLILIASACTTHKDFNYPPQEISDAPKTNLRIAVMPFRDKRVTIRKDWSDLAFIPLVPYGVTVYDAPQSESARSSAEYYYPDLIAYGLTKDLLHNNVAEVVHLAPALVDDYDLVIFGNLEGLPNQYTRLSYGLSFLSYLLPAIAIPNGTNSTEAAASYLMTTPDRTGVFQASLKGSHTMPLWGPDFERGNGYVNHNVKALQAITKAFVSKAAPAITKFANRTGDKKRRFAYYHSLDPELVRIESALNMHQRSGNRQAESILGNEYKRRLDWLERYRKKEWEILNKQQNYKSEVFEKRLTALAQHRGQKRAIRYEEARRQAEYEKAQKSRVNAALAAALLPAARATSANAGKASAEILGNLAADAGAALSAVPNIPPPPPLDPSLKNISVDLTGLSGAGDDPFRNIKGKSLQDIRQNFLRLYQSKRRNVERYL